MRTLIPGPALIGFAELFDGHWGDTKTPRPYPIVTPSAIGGAPLPFPCVWCGEKQERDRPRDRERGFSFCPSCRGRYIVKGTVPLIAELPAGATVAPAVVNGQKPTTASPLDFLGC